VRDHPVLFKITTLKKTLEGLRGLDAKLESVLRRKLKGKGFTPLIGKRQDREDEKVENEDDSYGEEDEDDGEDGEEEMEDEEMGSDDNVVDTDALLTKTE
jgi:hypothetical protein